MGIGEGRRRPQEGRGRQPDDLMAADRRPEAGHHQVAQIDRDLQAARWPGHRLQGHAPQGAYVRIPRSAREHRAAARSRLPWTVIRRASTAAATTRIGIKGAHRFFPEIDYDKAAEDMWGMDITVCTTATQRRRSARAADRIQLPVPAVRPGALTARSSNADQPGELRMAKKSSIEKNNRRKPAGEEIFAGRRSRLKAIASWTRPSRWKSDSRRP